MISKAASRYLSDTHTAAIWDIYVVIIVEKYRFFSYLEYILTKLLIPIMYFKQCLQILHLVLCFK